MPVEPTEADEAHLTLMTERCKAWHGEPRIEAFGPRVLGAFAYDLANVFLIKTGEGNVFIDAGLSPKTAEIIYKELTAKAPGKTRAVIYTHSHLDHVGGAAVFAPPGTEIWASEPFTQHFLKQYGAFQPAEMIRGARQYGAHVPSVTVPCTSIGPKPDLVAAFQSGARLPNKAFKGRKDLVIGGVKISLIEAHGETHDEIMIWLPQDKILFAGDNIYKAFPNLYTIRGTSARPVDDWILSLDAMRALEPETLLPSHTGPLKGKEAIQETLTAYRDGIQWVRDATVAGANLGLSADTLAENIKLPPHLARHPYLEELYGQVDWSVRAIYSDHLGWFAGEPERLYPMDRNEQAKREVGLMGGVEALVKTAKTAMESGDVKWSIHLLTKVRSSGLATGKVHEEVTALLSKAYGRLALTTVNSNGRGYLAESSMELSHKLPSLGKPAPDEALVQSLPIDIFMNRWGTRLKMHEAVDVFESVVMKFPDIKKVYYVTIRRGVTEVSEGKALPGTPAPVAVVEIDSQVWKRLALKQENAAAAVATGKIQVGGSWVDFGKFLARFHVD